MRTNIFRIKEEYKRLKELGGITQEGSILNQKDNSMDYIFFVGSTKLILKEYPNSHSEIICECKFHCLKNSTKPESWCAKKSMFVLYLIEEGGKNEKNK